MDTFPNFSVVHVKFCLQVEPCDDTRGNDVSDIMHNSNDIQQVNYFMSYHLHILVT